MCVGDGKTITVNDKLESFVSKEGNKFENGVSKSDTVNNSSDIENRIRVEVDQRLIVSVNDLEREHRNSLIVEGEQGAKDVYKRQVLPSVWSENMKLSLIHI